MKITICTPFYNREQFLERVYKSLLNQTNYEFEWIIIDDGSIDNTKLKVREVIKNAPFNFKYIYQENLGKAQAVNNGVENASCEYFFVLDSDDWLYPNAVDNILKMVEEYPEVNALGFQCTYDNGDLVTSNFFPGNPWIGGLHELNFKKKIKGDAAIILRTEIMRQFLFPKYESEKFVPEGLIFHRIEKKHKYYFFNIPIKYVEYQDDGLSNNMFEIFLNNPLAYYQYCVEFINFFNSSIYQEIRHIVAVGVFGIIIGEKLSSTMKKIEKKRHKILFLGLYPLAKSYYLYLKKRGQI